MPHVFRQLASISHNTHTQTRCLFYGLMATSTAYMTCYLVEAAEGGEGGDEDVEGARRGRQSVHLHAAHPHEALRDTSVLAEAADDHIVRLRVGLQMHISK
jgi:hypothetical protein